MNFLALKFKISALVRSSVVFFVVKSRIGLCPLNSFIYFHLIILFINNFTESVNNIVAFIVHDFLSMFQ